MNKSSQQLLNFQNHYQQNEKNNSRNDNNSWISYLTLFFTLLIVKNFQSLKLEKVRCNEDVLFDIQEGPIEWLPKEIKLNPI